MGKVSKAIKAAAQWWNSDPKHSVERFGWGMASIIAIALCWLNWLTIDTLSDRTWCTQLTAVEKFMHDAHGQRPVSSENITMILNACRDVGLAQIDHIGLVAKILAGGLVLSVVSVFMVKFAGARASGEIGGANFDISANASAHQAAEAVAAAAEARAEDFPSEERI